MPYSKDHFRKIETHLALHEQVKEAVVVAREDNPGERHLVAYFTKRDERALNVEELRLHLKRVLPECIAPSAFVLLEKIPLTPNGKVDDRALSHPNTDKQLRRQDIATYTPTEKLLIQIFAEVFGREVADIHDKFFDLGGNSITMMRALSKVKEVTARSIDIVDLFKYPTVSELAAYCDGSDTDAIDTDKLRLRAEQRRQKIKRAQRSRTGAL